MEHDIISLHTWFGPPILVAVSALCLCGLVRLYFMMNKLKKDIYCKIDKIENLLNRGIKT